MARPRKPEREKLVYLAAGKVSLEVKELLDKSENESQIVRQALEQFFFGKKGSDKGGKKAA